MLLVPVCIFVDLVAVAKKLGDLIRRDLIRMNSVMESRFLERLIILDVGKRRFFRSK
jgi:hypothetical protein